MKNNNLYIICAVRYDQKHVRKIRVLEHAFNSMGYNVLNPITLTISSKQTVKRLNDIRLKALMKCDNVFSVKSQDREDFCNLELEIAGLTGKRLISKMNF